mgnify:FL=1|uniref:DUF7936 domain-containing protein n=1 Tax=uncultured virus TaxID=340016 RepID=A0A219PVZ9_9VIRU|nr:hypothetical protein [uncultured virus]
MITYDWNCKTVDVHPQEDEQTDVVYNVHWIVTGTDGDYSSNAIGTQIVPLSEGGAFIPFEDLTNEIVVEWTKEAMGEETVESIEAGIASQIESLINPTSVTMTIGE